MGFTTRDRELWGIGCSVLCLLMQDVLFSGLCFDCGGLGDVFGFGCFARSKEVAKGTCRGGGAAGVMGRGPVKLIVS
ncbi:hypothetical protein Ancab_012863 [Ancistrocladus abbreviatus]